MISGKDKKRIVIIGGINMDVGGKLTTSALKNDSNIGKISLSFGGVGRNIGENLARIGEDVSMMTAFGNDMFGREIMNNLQSLNIDTTLSSTYDCNTSTYLYVMDNGGDMQIAINDMDIYNHLTVEKVQEVEEKLNCYDIIVIDTNLREDVIEYILKNLKPKKAVDPVSVAKAYKIKNLLQYIDYFKPNKMEATYLSGIEIKGIEDEIKVANWFISKGVGKIFISLGEEGCIYGDKNEVGKIKGVKTQVSSSTGAGDAFMAGIIRESMYSQNVVDMCISGSSASIIALKSNDTVNCNMSSELLEKYKLEVKRNQWKKKSILK